MSLTWNEIRKRAIEFSNEWKGETRENAESQTFWNEFFSIFGISRRRMASFEKNVEMLGDKKGSIDLFWKGLLLVEHKSEGRDLEHAYKQAIDYFPGLKEHELPRYVIVTDFKRIRLHDLDENEKKDFMLEDLRDNVHLFDFMLGHARRSYKDEDPVNVKAAELMGRLHDSLKANGYEGHPLEVLLVRLMFCLFADDTGIFPERGHFSFFIENKTNEDGSDVGLHLTSIFQTLNVPDDKRQTNLDEDLNKFPYVDGTLFRETLPIPSFNSDTRRILLECCYFDWGRVSPAVFGSMFQSVMNSDERRDMGAHYTSEKNITKTINSLFLDDLEDEFKKHKQNKKYLEGMLEKIGKMKFLDPACGCGNFLIIAYRELRRLEIRIHKQIRKLEGQDKQRVLSIEIFNRDINVDSMYGIEILEFPAKIAETALWLVDHQLNIELSREFGLYYVRLPLKKAPHIINGNALEMEWNEIVPKNELTCILGNPPYVGKKRRSVEQNNDMTRVCGRIKNYGVLDYVCCWYAKAADYIKDTQIQVAFVSTNSITQGEQAGIIGEYLLDEKELKIHFAHRTFRWYNQAKGKAQVYVVIIGFSCHDIKKKSIFDYETPKSDPIEMKADNINIYLLNQKNITIKNRSKQISKEKEITFGSMPNDDGNFLFTDTEKMEFLKEEPDAKKYIRPFISAREFLHNEPRWCLWLHGANPSELKKLQKVSERVRKVKDYRLKSSRESTRKLAQTPYLFGEIRQPRSRYLLIPRHSSENRKYIPMGFLDQESIAGDSCSIIENASLYLFGILSSCMHMAWVKQMCGRIKSDFRYSNKLVYNNFSFPQNASKKEIKIVEDLVIKLLDIRKKVNLPLSDIYDPLYMNKEILNLHRKLDNAVDRCYAKKQFRTDLERLHFLFDLYEKYERGE